MIPSLITGGMHADNRGMLRFVNDFDMTAVKRFYTIANSAEEPKRGWIMHKKETKWFFPLKGKTTIVVQSVHDSGIEARYVLIADNPQVLEVPPDFWFLIEQDGEAEVQVFSNCRVGEFKDDDFRRAL